MKQKQLRKQSWHARGSMSVSSGNDEVLQKFSSFNIFNIFSKSLTLVLLFLEISTVTSAQMEWGIKAGANASTQSDIGNIYKNDGLKMGVNAGVIARYQMNNWLALKSGLDYKTVGSKKEVTGEDSKLEYDLSYLSLPVKAEFSASEKAGFKNGQRLFFATGPYCAYLLDSKQKYEGVTSDFDDANDLDLGWAFELGFEFPVCKKHVLQLSLNYDMGLTKIVDDNDIRNKSASLNFGFLF